MLFNQWGKMARDLPPGVDIPIMHPHHRNMPIGMCLGGKGFIPNISERQFYESGYMNAVTKFDDIINARASGYGDDLAWTKTATMGGVSGVWYSLFRYAGTPGTIAPGNINTGTTMNNASQGALGLVTPTGGRGKYLLTAGVNVSALGFTMLLLCDLLWCGANVTTNVGTGAQTVNSNALVRYTSGAGVMMICAVTTALGASAANITFSYLDQGGNAGSSGAVALTASCVVQRLQPVMSSSPFVVLAAGDYGVTQIVSITVSALMGAGVMDAYLIKPLAFIPTIAATTYVERDSTAQIDGLTQLPVGSDNYIGCLGFLGLTSSTTTCTANGMLRTCEG